MSDRAYFLLGGILNNINALNYFMSRKDYPNDLISDNRVFKNIILFARRVHDMDGINIPYTRLVDFVCAAHKIPLEEREDDPTIEKYTIVYDKAEEAYEKAETDDYMDLWQAEFRWAVEDYVRRTRLDCSRKEHLMMKSACFGEIKSLDQCKECECRWECQDMKKSCQSAMKYVAQWREEQEERIRAVQGETEEEAKIVVYSDNLEDRSRRYKERYQAVLNNDGKVELPYSMEILNTLTGGWKKQRVVCITGRTGMGKSAYALWEALFVYLNSKVNVIYFDLEMPREEVEARLDSATTGYDFSKILNHRWESQEELAGFLRALKEQDKRPNEFVIIDKPNLSIPELKSYLKRYYRRWGDNFIVVLDNLNITEYPKGLPDHRGAAYISQSFHELMKTYNISGMMLSQLNRDADNETDKLSSKHLRDSDAIGDHVDWMAALVKHSDCKRKFIFMKGRYFLSRSILLEADLAHMRFREVDNNIKESNMETLYEEAGYAFDEDEELSML